MGAHLIDGEFQSDKYPTTPRGKVPLSCKDKTAQDLLWAYAQRRRPVDAEFSDDLEEALLSSGFTPDDHEPVKSYRNALAAAQNASEAAAELLRCAREDDHILIDDVLEKLLDAARLVAEIEARPEDAQVLGAVQRWIDGDR